MIYKKDNQVANISDGGTGYIITQELSGVDAEYKYTIERVEPFDPKEWEEGSDDNWLLYWDSINGMLTMSML